jgi:hypothetical protein
MAMTAGERMGWLRAGVGLVMMTAPGPIVGISKREPRTQTAVLLLRTIGIRDIALGMGVVAAARSRGDDDLRRWTLIAMASDSMDVLASVASRRSIGSRDSSLAALLAIFAVLGDLQALAAMGAQPTQAIPAAAT